MDEDTLGEGSRAVAPHDLHPTTQRALLDHAPGAHVVHGAGLITVVAVDVPGIEVEGAI